MARYFSADLHFGHVNIIRYCVRPYADAEEMNADLVEGWNDVVGDEDEVWLLGDVAMGRIAESIQHVSLLRGRKILVAGNHDRCWHGHHKGADRWVDEYLDAGFAEIVQGQTSLTITGADSTSTGVEACHFPYAGDSHDADRYREHRPADRGAWLLHGHVHEQWRQHGRQINVGTDVWDHRPVSEHQVAELIAAGPRTLDRHGNALP